jgi:uncharacterized protein YukE
MNQITIETSIVETETTELGSNARQIDEALTELNSTQLALVGGGSCCVILD